MDKLPVEIIRNIAEFAVSPKYKLADVFTSKNIVQLRYFWRNKYLFKYLLDNNFEMFLDELVYNESRNAIDYYMEKRTNSISRFGLSQNPAVIDILEKNVNTMVDWNGICLNEKAFNIIKNNITKVNIYYLPFNPYFTKLVNIKSCDLSYLKIRIMLKNTNDIDIINSYINTQFCRCISANPYAIEILENNPGIIDWEELSHNYNAIDILKNNIGKIDWDLLNINKRGWEILKYNQDRLTPVFNCRYGGHEFDKKEWERVVQIYIQILLRSTPV